MAAPANIWNHSICFGTITQTTDDGMHRTVWINRTGTDVELVSAHLTGTATGAATHYQTITLCDNSGNTLIAKALDTATADNLSTTPLSMGTLDAAYKVINADEQVYFKVTQTGTGQAITGFTVHLAYKIVRPGS